MTKLSLHMIVDNILDLVFFNLHSFLSGDNPVKFQYSSLPTVYY